MSLVPPSPNVFAMCSLDMGSWVCRANPFYQGHFVSVVSIPGSRKILLYRACTFFSFCFLHFLDGVVGFVCPRELEKDDVSKVGQLDELKIIDFLAGC